MLIKVSILSVSTRIELEALGAFFDGSDSVCAAFLGATTDAASATTAGAVSTTGAGEGAGFGFFAFLGLAKGASSKAQSSSTQLML